jgi:hypothetical protein
VAARLPPPGPSFLREQELRIGDRVLRAGMGRPSTLPDSWFLYVLWVADDDGIVDFTAVAPAAGPPADPPLARLGPAMTGALSGWIREEDGRLAIRLSPVAPPADAARPWRAALAIRAAFGFEPMRAASVRPNELASTVLTAFRRSVEGLARR